MTDWLTTIETPFKGGTFVNTHIALGEYLLFIDSGVVDASYELMARGVTDQGRELGQLALIVNTHGHSDHVGNNGRLQRETGCLVAAHAGGVDRGPRPGGARDRRALPGRDPLYGRYPQRVPAPY